MQYCSCPCLPVIFDFVVESYGSLVALVRELIPVTVGGLFHRRRYRSVELLRYKQCQRADRSMLVTCDRISYCSSRNTRAVVCYCLRQETIVLSVVKDLCCR
jgi:hypothetical protein